MQSASNNFRCLFDAGTSVMLTCRGLCTILFLVALSSGSKISSLLDAVDLDIDIYRFEACNVSWRQLIISGVQKSVTKHSWSFDMDFHFISPLLKIKKGTVVVKSCKEAVSFNTCEHFARWHFGDEPCALFRDEHAFWTPVIHSSTPIFRCPFKGDTTYKVRNATIDVRLLKSLNLPLDRNIWNLEFRAADQNSKDYLCTVLEAKFVHYRQHANGNNNS